MDGARPHGGGDVPQIGDFQQSPAGRSEIETVVIVVARRAGLPTEIDRVVSKALAKDRTERYQHADELLVDLRVIQKQNVVQSI